MTLKLIDLLLPKFCFGCCRPGAFLCSSCQNEILYTKIPLCPICERPSPYGLTHPRCKKKLSIDGLFVLGDYRGILKKMLLGFKYKNVFSVSEILCQLANTRLPSPYFRVDIITPVPLHTNRLKERGYNQSEILAVNIAKNKNIGFSNNVLVRNRYTLPQMTLKSNKERVKNIKGVFSVVNREIIKSRSIALVDDIVTTGATIFETAKVLKRKGAGCVYGVVMARKIPSRYL